MSDLRTYYHEINADAIKMLKSRLHELYKHQAYLLRENTNDDEKKFRMIFN